MNSEEDIIDTDSSVTPSIRQGDYEASLWCVLCLHSVPFLELLCTLLRLTEYTQAFCVIMTFHSCIRATLSSGSLDFRTLEGPVWILQLVNSLVRTLEKIAWFSSFLCRVDVSVLMVCFHCPTPIPTLTPIPIPMKLGSIKMCRTVSTEPRPIPIPIPIPMATIPILAPI